MNQIKKAGIITGAVVGGAIGGAISFVGKMTNRKFIDELGESVIDSTILTGGIAGDIASGATNVISGKVKKDRCKVKEGQNELKSAGGQVVQNFVGNVQTIVDNSGEILEGVREKDRRKIVRGAKTLVKVAAVGTITVGAIKIKPEGKEPEENKPNEKEKDS